MYSLNSTTSLSNDNPVLISTLYFSGFLKSKYGKFVNVEFGIISFTPLSSVIMVDLSVTLSTTPFLFLISIVSPTLILLPIINMIPENRFEIMSFAAKLKAIPAIPKLNNVPARFIPNNCNMIINETK